MAGLCHSSPGQLQCTPGCHDASSIPCPAPGAVVPLFLPSQTKGTSGALCCSPERAQTGPKILIKEIKPCIDFSPGWHKAGAVRALHNPFTGTEPRCPRSDGTARHRHWQEGPCHHSTRLPALPQPLWAQGGHQGCALPLGRASGYRARPRFRHVPRMKHRRPAGSTGQLLFSPSWALLPHPGAGMLAEAP